MAKPLPYQIVKGARDLIADKSNWCRLDYAQSRPGGSANWQEDNAHRFCAAGALQRAAYDLVGDRNEAYEIAFHVRRELNNLCGESLLQVNDKMGHKAVLAVFDR